MRLPEAKIKQAIPHPEELARQEVLLYFADYYSREEEVLPLAIKAIETYGRSKAFLQVHVLSHLTQTNATVEWAIRELHREEDKAEDDDSYFPALSRLLCSTDPNPSLLVLTRLFRHGASSRSWSLSVRSAYNWQPGTPTDAGRN